MRARWASFGVGLWLVFAPLVLGHASAAAVLHDVALGLLVAVGALAALEWPVARFAQLVPALWLLAAGRAEGLGGGDPAAANQLAAGLALAGLAAFPSGRLLRRGPVAASASRAA